MDLAVLRVGKVPDGETGDVDIIRIREFGQGGDVVDVQHGVVLVHGHAAAPEGVLYRVEVLERLGCGEHAVGCAELLGELPQVVHGDLPEDELPGHTYGCVTELDDLPGTGRDHSDLHGLPGIHVESGRTGHVCLPDIVHPESGLAEQCEESCTERTDGLSGLLHIL